MTNQRHGQGRQARRRASTRQALIDAARHLLAEGAGAEASIQEITKTADVGFGSFYNHFTSKGELFAAATNQAMEEYGAHIDALTGALTDPAEVMVTSIRLTARLARTHPQIARILLAQGMSHLDVSTGLLPRALRDVNRGVAAGRFSVADPQLAVMVLAGGMLGLLHLQMSGRMRAGPQRTDAFATMMLLALGMSDAEARDVISSTH